MTCRKQKAARNKQFPTPGRHTISKITIQSLRRRGLTNNRLQPAFQQGNIHINAAYIKAGKPYLCPLLKKNSNPQIQ
jgi:hypothetical protein